MLNKKIKIISFLAIFLSATCVMAATTDFSANGDITVESVTFGSGTADMIIFDGSSAESFAYNSGTFTVVDPDSTNTFKIGSSDSSVKSIQADRGGSTVACSENTTPGTSYLTLPSDSGTYTVNPSTVTDCTSLCTRVDHAATYNSFPTCGAATCDSGYHVIGSGSSATCEQDSSGGGSYLSPGYTVGTNPESEEETTESEEEEYEEPSHDTGVSDKAGVPATDANGNVTLAQMSQDATDLLSGNVELIAALMALNVDPSQEDDYQELITSRIVDSDTPENVQQIINWFVTYGTKSTKILGAGERGGVVNSFKAAFGKLPTTQEDWNDIMKIANGRWPTQRSESAENAAKETFRKIYLREPNMDQPNDNAAVTVMAYGLRPANRNMDSEKSAIRIFKAIFNYAPSSATDWDAVRAIAYSGAVR